MAGKRLLGDWLRSYIEFTKGSEAPLQFHFWTGVSTIAGAVMRHVYFDQVHFKWHPNFYIVFVARPGVAKKSSTIDIGINILGKIEGVQFGPESTSWQSLIQRMAEARTMVEYPGVENPIPMCAITCPIAEFGTFFNSKDSMMTDHLVSLWDGKTGRFEKSTKTQGKDVIDNPWINIIAGTTPSWIKENFPDYMIGGGFMSRCVFVYGDKPRSLNAYIKKEQRDVEREELEKKLLDDLYTINSLRGEFTLSKDARIFGTEWYESLFTRTPDHLKDEQMQGYLARKQTHIHKLAMVLSLSEGNNLVISKTHLETALHITDGLERDLPKIFSSIGGNANANVTTVIYQHLIDHGSTSRTKLFERYIHKYEMKIIDQAIEALKAADMIGIAIGARGVTVYVAKQKEGIVK